MVVVWSGSCLVRLSRVDSKMSYFDQMESTQQTIWSVRKKSSSISAVSAVIILPQMPSILYFRSNRVIFFIPDWNLWCTTILRTSSELASNRGSYVTSCRSAIEAACRWVAIERSRHPVYNSVASLGHRGHVPPYRKKEEKEGKGKLEKEGKMKKEKVFRNIVTTYHTPLNPTPLLNSFM